MITGAQIVEEARLWRGTRFRHQGRRRAAPGDRGGVDCIGLVIGVGKALGLTVFDMTGYGRDPDLEGKLLKSKCDSLLLKSSYLAPGVIVLMEFGGYPRHMGIVGDYPGGELSLIHSYVESSGCVEHRLDPSWRSQIVERYTFPLSEVQAPSTAF